VTPRDLAEIALPALVRQRTRTGLSLLGVAIGVAAVVSLTALGEGARRYVVDQFAALGSSLLVILPGRTETTGAIPHLGGVPNDLTLEDARAVERLPGISRVAPLAIGNETVSNQARSRQVTILGATHEFLEVRELQIAQGQFLPPGDMERGAPMVVLGGELASELFPTGSTALGRIVRVGDWRMRVIGILARRGTQLGFDMDEVAIVPVATGLRMFNRTSLFRVLATTHAHESLDAACDRAVALLAERHDEEDVTCITQDSVVAGLSSILTVLTLAVGAIAAVSLAVAGIGIMNLMLVSVSERRAEVGLLKAMGAANHQVLGVFLAEAILIAGAGGLLGLALGFGAIRVLVAFYPAFPAAPPLWALAAALGLSLVVGAVFGVLPARRAARLDPVVALAGR
jgi:putative ABC transport system permease protein